MFFEYPDHIPWIKVFHEDRAYYSLHDWSEEGGLFFDKIDKSLDISDKFEIIESFDDPSNKILINFHYDFFHAMVDFLGLILFENEKNSNTLFLLNIPVIESDMFSQTWNVFIFDTLNRMNIKYKVLTLNNDQVICASNLHIYERYLPLTYQMVDLLSKSAEHLYENKIPWRKVYLSRKKIQRTKSEEFLWRGLPKEQFLFQNDERIDNPDLMEQFFSDLGFEIICPEDFASFTDQVKYFSTVKKLAGVTTAGLLNSIYMPKGGTVFEMSTPLVGNGRESIHHFYKDLSFVKDHKFLSITNFRNASTIIDKIKQDKALLEFLSA